LPILLLLRLDSKRQQGGGGFEESTKVIFIDAIGDPTAAKCKLHDYFHYYLCSLRREQKEKSCEQS
jgi:hypothetical protein